jgi:hypothetical protein
LQPKLGQFISDARTTPGRIDGPHPADESNQLRVFGRSTSPTPGLPPPEDPESGSLPGNE